MSESILQCFKEDGYTFGNCAAIRYDRNKTDLFPEGYLNTIYWMCKESRRRSGNGILDTIFNPSNYDAVMAFLCTRPAIVIVGAYDDQGAFTPGGFAFVEVVLGQQAPEMACFVGYGFFKHTWGTPELDIMMMLGLAYLFQELNLKAIHGIRRPENLLTKKFTEPFGFKVDGEVPFYQLRNGVLLPGIVSTLTRTDFEAYVERFLIDTFPAEVPAETTEQVSSPTANEPEPEQTSLAWL